MNHRSLIAVAAAGLLVGCACMSAPWVCSAIRAVEKYGGTVSDDWPSPLEVDFVWPRSTLSDSEMPEVVKALHSFQSLQTLSLEGKGITDRSVDEIATLASLKDLTLRDTRITPKGLRRLRTMPSLQHVWVSAAGLPKEEAESLKRELPAVELSLSPAR